MSARRWLTWLSLCAALLGPQRAAAQDEDLGEDEEASEPEAGGESGEEPAADETADAEAPDAAEAAPAAASDAETGHTLRARAVVGGGAGTRWLRRPIVGGGQRLSTTVFPAADIGLSVRLWPVAAFSFDVMLRYQTSLGLTIEERPLFALKNEVDVRAEHAELGVGPSFRLGAAAEAARLGFPVGVAIRNFWPAEHQLQTPRYTLVGPYLRAELEVPLGSVARLRLGPEAHVFFGIGTDLSDYGVSRLGVAFGGEAGLQFRLSERFLIELQYRQSNALASSDSDPSFLDVERFVTARWAGEM